MSIKDAFNWAATPPERPFTITDEFNRIAGNPPGEFGGIKWGRGARIVERAIMGLGVLGLIAGTSMVAFGALPGAAGAGGVVLGVVAIKGVATAAAALTQSVVKVGQALTGAKKKVGVGPGSPTPSP